MSTSKPLRQHVLQAEDALPRLTQRHAYRPKFANWHVPALNRQKLDAGCKPPAAQSDSVEFYQGFTSMTSPHASHPGRKRQEREEKTLPKMIVHIQREAAAAQFDCRLSLKLLISRTVNDATLPQC